jgi:exonuclease III
MANIYAPNQDETNSVEKLLEEIYGRNKDDLIIMAGDWNTILDNLLDKLGGARYHANRKRQSLLTTAMNELGLHDPFRLENPESCLYTHVNKKYNTQSRLDFFLVDNNVINFPKCTSTISHGFRSDHSYVQLKLKGNKIDQGKGY